MPVHFPLKLVSSHMLAPTVRHLAFRRDDGEALDFIPGQFLQVHFTYEDGKATKRSYSVATQRSGEPQPDDLIEIAVSYVPGGAATDIFEHLEEGQQIEASGPYGRFCLQADDSNRRYSALAMMLRSRFLKDIDCWSQARGQPIKPGDIVKAARAQLQRKGRSS